MPAPDNIFDKIETDIAIIKWMLVAALAGVATLVLKAFSA